MGLPLGIRLFNQCGFSNLPKERLLMVNRLLVLFFTYLTYTLYHMSRKVISVVKTEPQYLNCTEDAQCTSWIDEMDGVDESKGSSLQGFIESSYLFSYAFFMFVSGFVAERVNLRYFLSLGMLGSGIFTIAFGVGRLAGIHSFGYFLAIQIIGGAFQTTGWPGVVTVVANWFGKGKKGLIFGVWNSHTSVGNILGSFLAGLFVADNWGISFLVPGIIIMVGGVIIWLFLLPKPEDIDLSLDELQIKENYSDPSECTIDAVDTEKNPANSAMNLIEEGAHDKAIGIIGALKIPGVIEFSLCLFFAKLVSYTFLYHLPTFISSSGENISPSDAAFLSTLFDVGGIIGGIMAGLITDYTGKSASTCAAMLVAAIPMVFIQWSYGENCPIKMDDHSSCYTGNITLLIVLGLLVNGPYALITTAVSAELGTHPSLKGSSKALATVTAIIDGTGSIGAAVGPFLANALPSVKVTVYTLMGADIMALLLITRLVVKDIREIIQKRRAIRQADKLSLGKGVQS